MLNKCLVRVCAEHYLVGVSMREMSLPRVAPLQTFESLKCEGELGFLRR